MIEVRCYSNDQLVATAEADDAEAALLAARTLWDEASSGTRGQRRAVVFEVEGGDAWRYERRP